MLLTNHNCGWATQFFQKNVARWKHWPTPNDDTASRLKLAQDGIAECERRMMR
jgi:spore cortex formation protein SpoVR/YcgB (stage V sporulation)